MREQPEIKWPTDVTAALIVLPEAKEIIESQKMTFTARRNNMNSDIKSLDESIKALDERIQGSLIQLECCQAPDSPAQRGIETRIDWCRPDRAQAGIDGAAALEANLDGRGRRVMGYIGDAKERIARAREQINGVRKTAIKTASNRCTSAGANWPTSASVLSAKGVLDRVRIAAP